MTRPVFLAKALPGEMAEFKIMLSGLTYALIELLPAKLGMMFKKNRAKGNCNVNNHS
jgi:hypothetical protein